MPTREEVARLARGVAASGGVVVELGPLAGAEVAELAGRRLGGAPGRRVTGGVEKAGPLAGGEGGELGGSLRGAARGRRLTGVLEQAGGNPLYVAELADALVRDGRVQVAEGVAELVGEPGGVRVPVSLAAAIGERLAGLTPEAVGGLGWAAVAGGEFSLTDRE